MAFKEYSKQFIDNLPLINGVSADRFFRTLLSIREVDRINLISKAIDEQKDVLPEINWSIGKDDKKSQHYRTIGNECFVRLEFTEALKYYNKAIAFAKSDDTLSICYANRSAVYYELSLFSICLENIQMARRYLLPDRIKLKLDQRQQAAVTQFLSKYVTYNDYKPKLCRPPMQRQPFFIDCLTKQSNQILTKEALAAGDIISLETPYSQVLAHSHIYERCTYCLTNKKFMSMIPCLHCTSAMFCNQKCYTLAQKLFHHFECPIIDGLFYFLPDSMYLGLRTVFININHCKCSPYEYRDMLERCQNNDNDPFHMNIRTGNRSNNEMVFSIIHNMSRSFSYSTRHYMAVTILMNKLTSYSGLGSDDPTFFMTLTMSILQMLQVSTENRILLEETDFTGDVGNDVTVYGCGLFPFGSTLKLSCAPNVLFLSCNGTLAGVVIRPIKPGLPILPGLMSQNHFLTDREIRTNRMEAFNCDLNPRLCYCFACESDFDLLTDQPLLIERNVKEISAIPLEITEAKNPAVALKFLCKYLDENHNKLPYLCWEMGWCMREMIRILRQLLDVDGTDRVFTRYLKLRKSA